MSRPVEVMKRGKTLVVQIGPVGFMVHWGTWGEWKENFHMTETSGFFGSSIERETNGR